MLETQPVDKLWMVRRGHSCRYDRSPLRLPVQVPSSSDVCAAFRVVVLVQRDQAQPETGRQQQAAPFPASTLCRALQALAG